MSSYPYAWLLVVIVVGTPVLLTNAYLALIALMFVLPVVLLALAAAIVWGAVRARPLRRSALPGACCHPHASGVVYSAPESGCTMSTSDRQGDSYAF